MTFLNQTRRRSSGFAFFALLASTCFLALDLLGQEGEQTPEAMPEVVITARRVPETLTTVPISVSAITEDTLSDADVLTVRDAAIYAPNVFMNEFSARKLSNPYFRGVGASPANPGVTTYIDGVPHLNAYSASMEIVDVDQIEFVRGPQSTLFGRNALGGVINIQSRKPSANWSGNAQVEHGNYDLWDTRARVSGPIQKGFTALSLAGGFTTRSGFTENDVTGNDLDSREAWFGKSQLLWIPNDRWDVRLVLAGERARDGDYALGDLAQIRNRPHHVAHDYEGSTSRDIIAPTLIAKYSGEQVDFSLTSGAIWWQTDDLTDLDYTAMPAAIRENKENAIQFTEEFRATSAKDNPLQLSEDLSFRWQSGALLFSQDYDQKALNTLAFPLPLASHTTSDLEDLGAGAYLEGTFEAWQRLDLSLGMRGDLEWKEASIRTFSEPALVPPGALSDNETFSQLSPQASLSWRATSNYTAYALVTRGYKAGGFNSAFPTGGAMYEEETSWNYELGIKTRLFSDRLSVRAAVFYLDWEDLQLNLPTGMPGEFFINNSGQAASRGAEIEVAARPLTQWSLFASAGVADAEFRSGSRALHITPTGTSTIESVGGNKVPYAPEFTFNSGTQYDWALGRGAVLYARAEVSTVGRYQFNPANTASQKPFSIASFRAGVRKANWFAEGWIRNAFDTDYVPVAFEYPNFQSGMVGEVGPPMTLGLRAGVKF